MTDVYGHNYELRYYRDRDGREVDFAITERFEPILLVECKLRNKTISRGLRFLARRFPQAKAWQIHKTGTTDFVSPDGIRVAPAIELLSGLV